MGFEGIVMKVSVKDFLFGGIKTGTAGWMIGLRKDQPQHDVLYVTDRLPTTAFGRENGFALFNHKNDTMENEWYEVSVSTSFSTYENHSNYYNTQFLLLCLNDRASVIKSPPLLSIL